MFKSKSFRSTIGAVSIGLASVLAVGTANAAIIGTTQFLSSGSWADMSTYDGGPVSYSPSNINDATGIDFGSNAFFGGGNGFGTRGAVMGASSTGDLAFLNGGFGTIADLRWDTDPHQIVSNPFIIIGAFELEIASFTVTQDGSDSIEIRGEGTMTIDGADATFANWILNTNQEAGQANVSLYISSTANVPEPSAAALLALGIVGLVLGRRLSRRA